MKNIKARLTARQNGQDPKLVEKSTSVATDKILESKGARSVVTVAAFQSSI